MRVHVGPSKREGKSRVIFNRCLSFADIRAGDPSGSVAVSIDAEGIYAEGSKYRYTLQFSLDELQAMMAARKGKLAVGADEVRSAKGGAAISDLNEADVIRNSQSAIEKDGYH